MIQLLAAHYAIELRKKTRRLQEALNGGQFAELDKAVSEMHIACSEYRKARSAA